ncbi:MAG: hypothetical protein Q6K35_02255, partial [Thermostichus sp. DG02_4_bins_136]
MEVAGTVAADEQGQVMGCGDPYGQTRFILSKSELALDPLCGKPRSTAAREQANRARKDSADSVAVLVFGFSAWRLL